MKRRVLDACLLAYPRVRRERDREYLRDLALELAEKHGLWRQAISLLGGGLVARMEALRRLRGAERSAWITRFAAACSVLAAIALAASGLIWPAAGEGERVEVEAFKCVDVDQSRPHRVRAIGGSSGCSETKSIVAARVRGGWDCETHRDARGDLRAVSWRCSL